MSAKRKNLIAALGGGILAVLIVAAYYTYSAWSYYQAMSSSFGKSLYTQDPLLGYRLKPELHFLATVPPAFWIFTDSHGVRVGDDPPDLSQGVSILAAGCSVTFGQRVMHEESFPGRIGKSLGVTTYNLGISGFSTLSSMLHAKEFFSLKPRVVIYGLIDDHFHRNLLPCTSFWRSENCRATVYLRPGEAGGFERVHPVTRTDFHMEEEFRERTDFSWRDVAWAVRRDWRKALGVDAARINARAAEALEPLDQLNAMTFLMDEWHGLAQKNHFELVVVYIPSADHPAPLSPEKRALFEAMEKLPNFHFVDSYPSFRSYLDRNAEGSLCAAPDDCHPSAEGHRLIADTLEPVLRRILGGSGRNAKGSNRHE